MLPVAAAIDEVLGRVRQAPSDLVPLADALARVLAGDIRVAADVPAFANSQMDGVAVRAQDLAGASEEHPIFLPLGETLGAGDDGETPLRAGQACRIMTGAPLPPGADAVVAVEDLLGEAPSGHAGFSRPVKPGKFVRPAGEDMAAGSLALAAGRRLRPADIGLLAALGRAEVSCVRPPRVAVLGTGSELVPLGQPLTRGKIHDSNAWALAAAVSELGAVPIQAGRVPDSREALKVAFADALACDVVLSTGGVSVGDFDYVKEVMAEIGLEQHFWRVAQKPGKPLTFATAREGQLFFGLPGNPVSAMVCFELYVAPALRAMTGRRDIHLPWADVGLARDIRTVETFAEMVRCRVVTRGMPPEVEPTGTQSSGALRSLSLADCLVISPPGVARLRAGDRARAIFLRSESLCGSRHAFG